MSSAFHYIPWLSLPCSRWAAELPGWELPHLDSNMSAVLFLPQLRQPRSQKQEKKKKKRQHVHSRRVCYANNSVVSLTQEKQLLPLPLSLTGLTPSGIFATTQEKKSQPIIWNHLGNVKPTSPCLNKSKALCLQWPRSGSSSSSEQMKWKEAVAVYVGSRFKL